MDRSDAVTALAALAQEHRLEVYRRLVQAGPEEKRRLVDDPEWRAEARRDADTQPGALFPFRRAELLTINGVARPEQREWIGRSLDDLARARGAPYFAERRSRPPMYGPRAWGMVTLPSAS